MARFAVNRTYTPDLDIRFRNGQTPSWADSLVQAWSPNDQCWLVVLPRRGGKSWLAMALLRQLNPGAAVRVDLRGSAVDAHQHGLRCLLDGKTEPAARHRVVLVDEPGLAVNGEIGVAPEAFVSGVRLLRRSEVVPIVFATPREHSLLMSLLGSDGYKDVVSPPPLTDAEIAAMANRAPDWAPQVVTSIRRQDPSWLETPFLLELALHIAEEHASMRDDVPALLRAAVELAKHRHAYIFQVFHNGLVREQRAALRASRWRAAGITIPTWCPARGQLGKTTVPLANDPVVASHLADVLRVHHLSDLHHGGGLRANVDAKDDSEAGLALAQIAGAGTPLDSYLSHVRQLRDQEQAPHLVIVSGDIVHRPSAAAGRQALDWLEQLQSLLADHRDLHPDESRIVLVGGNHDVSWDLCLDPDRRARHRWFAETFDGFPHPDLHQEAGAKRRLVLKYSGAGLRLILLGSAESGGELANDGDRRNALSALQERLASVTDDRPVHDLLQEFERIDPGVLSDVMLKRLKAEDGFVTFAVLHHPLSPVPAVEVAHYSGVVNAGQAKQALAVARTALVLHGHTHLAFMSAEQLISHVPEWTIRIAGAATLAAATSDEQNGYNQIFLAREGGDHTVIVRPVRLAGGQWIPGDPAVFRPGAASGCQLDQAVDD